MFIHEKLCAPWGLRPRFQRGRLLLMLAWLGLATSGLASSVVGVGNLVFMDINQNSRADPGEGVNGVHVDLFVSGANPDLVLPFASQVTANDGRFLFSNLPPGSYFMRIAREEFEYGKPLYQAISIYGFSVTGDDDTGHDALYTFDTQRYGVSTLSFTLGVGTAPVSVNESGLYGSDDDWCDDSIDLTHDFGFRYYSTIPSGIGNTVFIDGNGDGHYSSGEGAAGVRVWIYNDDDNVLVDLPRKTALTDAHGRYRFGNLPYRGYIVVIPPSEFAAGKPLYRKRSLVGAGAPGLDDDVDEDGLDDFEPEVHGIRSGVITLINNAAPSLHSGETGNDASSDDIYDEKVDLTVDFGFAASVGVGNLVFVDHNGNGHADASEGVPGVKVELLSSQETVLRSVLTGPTGQYYFGGLAPGDYAVRVPATEFAAGHALSGALSMSSSATGDDNAGEDGRDDMSPGIQGVATSVFTIAIGSAPTGANEAGLGGDADNANDADVDLTRDLGFTLPSGLVGLGNLVFIDANKNGHADSGEGVAKVSVRLFVEGDDPLTATPVASRKTASDGTFLFENLQPGRYFVHIPSAMFAPGFVLFRSEPLTLGSTGLDDDAGQKGFSTGSPTVEGVRCAVVELALGAAPTLAESGFHGGYDDFHDSDVDMTVDFGFMPPPPRVSVGNLVFVDLNENGHADVGEGVAGVKVQLFIAGQNPLTEEPLAQHTTGASGDYLFSDLDEGAYFVHIPVAEFQVGGPLLRALPLANPDTGRADDDVGQNGIATGLPERVGVSCQGFYLESSYEPTWEETGYMGSSDNAQDAAVNLTVDFGFFVASNMGVGNLVFMDGNHNGHADTGEGLPGVVVRLYSQGDDPFTASPLQVQTTDSNGHYLFTNLIPGSYFVHVPASQFASGAVLGDAVSVTGNGFDNGLDDGADENGADALTPSSTGISSVTFSLSAGTEPLSSSTEMGLGNQQDDSNDANVDLTIDLGFDFNCPAMMIAMLSFAPMTVGYAMTASLPTSGGTAPYVYTVVAGQLPPGMTLSSAGDFSGTPAVAGSYSVDVRVADAAGCVSRRSVSMVIGEVVAVGNLVYWDRNANGHVDAGEAINGVTVQLYHSGQTPEVMPPVAVAQTANGGLFLFDGLASGSYLLHVPAAMFQQGAPLYQLVSAPGTSVTDDDSGEDGEDALAPETTGVSTQSFSLLAGSLPTGDNSELGSDAESDDARDANVDLTRDFGFVDAHPIPANFNEWLLANSFGINTSPLGDGDGDGESNLVEYALSSDPRNGLAPTTPVMSIQRNVATGAFSFSYRRRHGSHQDTTYSVQVLADLAQSPANWTTTSVSPVTVVNTDGTETVTYTGLESDAALLGSIRGFVRLRVGLDTTGDGIADSFGASRVMGWQAQDFAIRNQTFAVPFMAENVFGGSVIAVVGNDLSVAGEVGTGSVAAAFISGREYYAEVTTGPNAGQRWEIDEAASSAASIALLPAQARSTRADVPSDLTGASLAVRPHWRVNDLFPPSSYHSTNSSGTADQLIFYDTATSAFSTLWLFSNSGNPRWVTGIAFGVDAGLRVIAPCDGLYVRPRFAAVQGQSIGVVRSWPMACPLRVGNNFIGNPWPVARSTLACAMTVGNGFTTANALSRADHISVWLGDTSTTVGYTGYYLLTSGAITGRWVRQSDLTFLDRGNEGIMRGGKAVFVISIAGKSDWVIPAPWVP